MSICWTALSEAGQRKVGGIAGIVADRGTVEIDRLHLQVGGVLTGRHCVGEGECAGTGAARVRGGAAVVERQRRAPAGGVDRHRLARADSVGDSLASVEVAA